MVPGMRERQVYLPEGTWKDIRTGETKKGGGFITAPAPLDSIPVYSRVR